MKIGLLGGSFNPPHLGHLHISQLALKKLNLDQLWWIPATHNPFKNNSSYLPFFTRAELCQRLIAPYPKIHLKLLPNIYAIDLIQKIKKLNPHHRFIWIAGDDLMQQLHSWKAFKFLLNQIEFAIFSRNPASNLAKASKAYSLYCKAKNYETCANDNFFGSLNYCAIYPRIELLSQKRLPKISFFRNQICEISSSKIRLRQTL